MTITHLHLEAGQFNHILICSFTEAVGVKCLAQVHLYDSNEGGESSVFHFPHLWLIMPVWGTDWATLLFLFVLMDKHIISAATGSPCLANFVWVFDQNMSCLLSVSNVTQRSQQELFQQSANFLWFALNNCCSCAFFPGEDYIRKMT